MTDRPGFAPGPGYRSDVTVACTCPECSDGPGIDYGERNAARRRRRLARMNTLMQKENLTPAESGELDGLIYSLIHG